MDHYSILIGYLDKQLTLVNKLYKEIINLNVEEYDKRFVFSLKTQQFYTAIEDLFKQIAKAFENHIENLESFHKELLIRMNTEIPNIRPKVLSVKSLVLLDKLRSFRHFIRHAYDCELDPNELINIQNLISKDFAVVTNDLDKFRTFVLKLI